MNPNPFGTSSLSYYSPPGPPAYFWLLVLASIVIAIYAFSPVPGQRSATHVCDWGFRVVIGAMWWEQTLWKLPPSYTDHPEQPFGEAGLAYWITVMGKSAAVPLQADFVNNIVLPHFYLFAPIVYLVEVLTAVSLILGTLVRVWAVIGALRIVNLWLGLYSAPGESPWTYFFLLVLMLIFALHRFGRSLGLDAVVIVRSRPETALGRILLDATT